MDASNLSSLPLKGYARAVQKRLKEELTDYRITGTYRSILQERKARWEEEYERVTTLPSAGKLQQPNVLRAVNEDAGPSFVVICAWCSLLVVLAKLCRRHVYIW